MESFQFDMKIGQESLPFSHIVDLYNSVGWRTYTQGEQQPRLHKAIQNSTYIVTAWSGKKMIGLARCLSDDVSICYLQDILVHPDYQRHGAGRTLLQKCLKRFEHVRMHVLLTDAEERQRAFYESLGYKNTKELHTFKLNAFVRIAGMTLE